jgi:CPA2 family monovalent cation:H+ antiporter-2
VTLQLMPPEGRSLVLAGALISIALNAAVFAAVEPLRQWVLSRSALARRLEERDDPLAQLPMSTDLRLLSGQVVLVGHGRVGRRIAAMLRADGIAVVVVEQNREAVDALRRDGVPAVAAMPASPRC